MDPGEDILDQFLGNDDFPVSWASENEQLLFWVYDDLHCPQPLSPMFSDIGGWWLTCDHRFRRFGTPFAVDWLAKDVNGHLYTAAIPAKSDLILPSTERRDDLPPGCAGPRIQHSGCRRTSEATHHIASGDCIRVDGTNGTVEIVARAAGRASREEFSLG